MFATFGKQLLKSFLLRLWKALPISHVLGVSKNNVSLQNTSEDNTSPHSLNALSSYNGREFKFDISAGFTMQFTEKEKLTHMPDSFIEAMQKIALDNNIVIIFRPVNPDALSWMKAGCQGKSMFVHSKSAVRGILKGLVPVEAALSKANPEHIAKFNIEACERLSESASVMKSIHDHIIKHAEERLSFKNACECLGYNAESLCESLLLPIQITHKGKDMFMVKLNGVLKQNNHGHPMLVVKAEEGFVDVETKEQISSNDFTSLEAVKAFGGYPQITPGGELDSSGVKAITADADILALGVPSEEMVDPLTNYRSLVQEQKEAYFASIGYIDCAQYISKPVSKLQPDDHITAEDIKALKFVELQLKHLLGMGEAPLISQNLIGYLRKEGQGIVFHNPEQFNCACPQPLEQTGWVIIRPRGGVDILQSQDELLEEFTKARKEGMFMPPNPAWGWEWDAVKQRFHAGAKDTGDNTLTGQNQQLTISSTDTASEFTNLQTDTQNHESNISAEPPTNNQQHAALPYNSKLTHTYNVKIKTEDGDKSLFDLKSGDGSSSSEISITISDKINIFNTDERSNSDDKEEDDEVEISYLIAKYGYTYEVAKNFITAHKLKMMPSNYIQEAIDNWNTIKDRLDKQTKFETFIEKHIKPSTPVQPEFQVEFLFSVINPDGAVPMTAKASESVHDLFTANMKVDHGELAGHHPLVSFHLP